VSTLLHAIVCLLHNLLNILVQIPNKMGLQKNLWNHLQLNNCDVHGAIDRLCGLVDRVPGYISIDPGSGPGAGMAFTQPRVAIEELLGKK
jgi:hypothetical protein